VTLSFSRASRRETESVGRPLAYGVLAACTTLFVRVVVATAVLHFPLSVQLAPLLAAPFLTGTAAVLIGLRRPRRSGRRCRRCRILCSSGGVADGVLFQVVLFMVEAVRTTWAMWASSSAAPSSAWPTWTR